ncbi:MAG: HK97 family phage prohead protease [Intestinibacter bartlettii]|uniref:HK97 family phage prohead protease n=1 Tax=Intestinibacter bartlettii TaxID=261299 RepID=UPI0029130668|nr:HK97 family phage prohead protease [Intestinibacter bartlettii]MDU6199672.1 HK97 family phage prohead protease [Intestinibacter bartlettii]
MESKGLDLRSYNCEVRAEKDESEGAVIVGRPIVYDSKTDLGYFEEVIEKGALEKTDLSDVRFLVNHDTSKLPLARFKKGEKNSTMSINVDDKGMTIRVSLDVENNTEARNLYSAVQRRDISGMSFMFGVDSEEWENLETDYPTRRIKGISSVAEVSAVTFPAYESTEINTRNKETLNSAKDSKQDVRKNDLELEKLKLKYLLGIEEV